MIKRRVLADDGITEHVSIDLLAATPEERAALVPEGVGGFEWRIADVERFWRQHARDIGEPPTPLTMPWYAKKILFYITVLRQVMARGRTDNPEAAIIAAMDLGRYTEEARWRFNFGADVRLGKQTRPARRKGGRSRGAQAAQQATRHDRLIARHVRAWQHSDELQAQYGYRSPVAYVRHKTGLQQRTIQRALQRLTAKKRDSS